MAGAAGRQNADTTGSKTININLNGRRSTIAVASSDDAQRLTALLRELESAANSSS